MVQLPGVKDAKRAIDLVGKTAILEFKLLDDESPVAAELPGTVSQGEEENLFREYAGKYLMMMRYSLRGSLIKSQAGSSRRYILPKSRP